MLIPEFLEPEKFNSYNEYINSFVAFKIISLFISDNDIEYYNSSFYAKDNGKMLLSVLENKYKNDYFIETNNHIILNVDLFIKELELINQTDTDLSKDDLSDYRGKLIKVFYKKKIGKITYCDIVEVIEQTKIIYTEI